MSSVAEKPFAELDGILPPPSPAGLGAWRSARRVEKYATIFEIGGDLFASMAGTYVAYSVYHFLRLGKHIRYSDTFVLGTSFIFAIMYVIMLDRDGAYNAGHGLLRIRETERALRVAVQTFLLLFPASVFAARLVSRWVLGLAIILVPLFLIIEKQLYFRFVRIFHARGIGIRRVLIYGAGFTGKRLYSALVRSPKLGLMPVLLVDDDPSKTEQPMYAFDYRRANQAPILAGPVSAEVIRQAKVDVVVIAIPTLDREKFAAVARCSAEAGADLAYVPALSFGEGLLVDFADIDGLMIANFQGPRTNRVYQCAKRTFDFVVTILILLLSSPLFAIIALAIKLNSNGTALFKQRRVGRDGKIFEMYKFRSMYVDAPKYAYSPRESDDPRITRIGRFLRRTSLDELPQLLNVLRGEMSLVGPRPEMPFIVEQYGSCEHQRLQVLPGITGVWQLSADRAFQIHENIQYDLYYIRNRGFFMDLAILLHTIIFAMRGV